MDAIQPTAARKFAVDVVRRLREAGFQSLWAGGCVRDQLLGLTPKDYDVATNATPNQVRELFGHRKTLAIGAAFGVISVMGPKAAGHIEVATFRRDASYSDGRHPDSVAFSTPEEDAQRRDFTINGLFFDPLENRVIDYVGGQEDLGRKIVRAIGDPRHRFGEDKLRMLRAVRFTATFGFALDEATLHAIRTQADDLVVVSAERIAAEMRRMLAHANRAMAVALLDQANLLSIVLPEAATIERNDQETLTGPSLRSWPRTLQILRALRTEDFTAALALLVREMSPIHPDVPPVASQARETAPQRVIEAVADRWRLANDERLGALRLLAGEKTFRDAQAVPWPQLQRLLITADVERRLAYTEAIVSVLEGNTESVDYCRERLRLPPEQLNPPPLVTGNDLKASGLKPGPEFKSLLESIRDAQLEERISTKEEAIALAATLLRPKQDPV